MGQPETTLGSTSRAPNKGLQPTPQPWTNLRKLATNQAQKGLAARLSPAVSVFNRKDTMKRYRVFGFDYDTRAISLEPVQEQWDEQVKTLHEENRKKTIEGLIHQFGDWSSEAKIQNFIDLGTKPFSIMAYHNGFLEQVRNSFVVGSYYPSLTGACALGERILNHLIITLRDYYKTTPEYKRVFKKSSFDNWTLIIDILTKWKILLPEATNKFRELSGKRNKAIHFNIETERNARQLALEAIKLLQQIIANQFSGFGTQPWFFWVPGECYIKKEWERKPFVKHVYIPNCGYVGYKHRVESVTPQWIVNDKFEYPEGSLTDEEFAELRKSSNKAT